MYEVIAYKVKPKKNVGKVNAKWKWKLLAKNKKIIARSEGTFSTAKRAVGGLKRIIEKATFENLKVTIQAD